MREAMPPSPPVSNSFSPEKSDLPGDPGWLLLPLATACHMSPGGERGWMPLTTQTPFGFSSSMGYFVRVESQVMGWRSVRLATLPKNHIHKESACQSQVFVSSPVLLSSFSGFLALRDPWPLLTPNKMRHLHRLHRCCCPLARPSCSPPNLQSWMAVAELPSSSFNK